MPDARQRVHVLMRGLVNRYGKQDAAAKAMADHWHPSGNAETWNTADLSMKMNGTRRWTFDDIMALQALTGSTVVTEAMCENASAYTAPSLSSVQHAAKLIKENSEAVTELLEGDDPAEQCKELLDLKDAIDAVLHDLGGAP